MRPMYGRWGRPVPQTLRSICYTQAICVTKWRIDWLLLVVCRVQSKQWHTCWQEDGAVIDFDAFASPLDLPVVDLSGAGVLSAGASDAFARPVPQLSVRKECRDFALLCGRHSLPLLRRGGTGVVCVQSFHCSDRTTDCDKRFAQIGLQSIQSSLFGRLLYYSPQRLLQILLRLIVGNAFSLVLCLLIIRDILCVQFFTFLFALSLICFCCDSFCTFSAIFVAFVTFALSFWIIGQTITTTAVTYVSVRLFSRLLVFLILSVMSSIVMNQKIN